MALSKEGPQAGACSKDGAIDKLNRENRNLQRENRQLQADAGRELQLKEAQLHLLKQRIAQLEQHSSQHVSMQLKLRDQRIAQLEQENEQGEAALAAAHQELARRDALDAQRVQRKLEIQRQRDDLVEHTNMLEAALKESQQARQPKQPRLLNMVPGFSKRTRASGNHCSNQAITSKDAPMHASMSMELDNQQAAVAQPASSPEHDVSAERLARCDLVCESVCTERTQPRQEAEKPAQEAVQQQQQQVPKQPGAGKYFDARLERLARRAQPRKAASAELPKPVQEAEQPAKADRQQDAVARQSTANKGGSAQQGMADQHASSTDARARGLEGRLCNKPEAEARSSASEQGPADGSIPTRRYQPPRACKVSQQPHLSKEEHCSIIEGKFGSSASEQRAGSASVPTRKQQGPRACKAPQQPHLSKEEHHRIICAKFGSSASEWRVDSGSVPTRKQQPHRACKAPQQPHLSKEEHNSIRDAECTSSAPVQRADSASISMRRQQPPRACKVPKQPHVSQKQPGSMTQAEANSTSPVPGLASSKFSHGEVLSCKRKAGEDIPAGKGRAANETAFEWSIEAKQSSPMAGQKRKRQKASKGPERRQQRKMSVAEDQHSTQLSQAHVAETTPSGAQASDAQASDAVPGKSPPASDAAHDSKQPNASKSEAPSTWRQRKLSTEQQQHVQLPGTKALEGHSSMAQASHTVVRDSPPAPEAVPFSMQLRRRQPQEAVKAFEARQEQHAQQSGAKAQASEAKRSEGKAPEPPSISGAARAGTQERSSAQASETPPASFAAPFSMQLKLCQPGRQPGTESSECTSRPAGEGRPQGPSHASVEDHGRTTAAAQGATTLDPENGAGRCRQTRSMTQPQQSAAILPASAQQPDDSSSGRSAPPQAILRAPKRRHVSSSAPESKSCQTQRSAAMPPTPAQQPEDSFLPAQDVPWAPKRRHGSWVAQQGDHTQPQDSAGTLLTAVQQLGAAESGQKRIKTSRDAAEAASQEAAQPTPSGSPEECAAAENFLQHESAATMARQPDEAAQNEVSSSLAASPSGPQQRQYSWPSWKPQDNALNSMMNEQPPAAIMGSNEEVSELFTHPDLIDMAGHIRRDMLIKRGRTGRARRNAILYARNWSPPPCTSLSIATTLMDDPTISLEARAWARVKFRILKRNGGEDPRPGHPNYEYFVEASLSSVGVPDPEA